MSHWPSSINRPEAVALLHWLDSHTQQSSFIVHEWTWPNLEITSDLPLHIIKVCAVAVNRGELGDLCWTPEERSRVGYTCKIPGFEFSGIVVSTSPHSPLCPGTEV